jgi:two-component system phosphate regulon sensor histidine kinase PhoR
LVNPASQDIAELVAAVIAAMPDPVVAVDAKGIVIAHNEKAQAFAPGLRRGEPVLLALRIPEIIEGIRQTTVSGLPHRAEFFERVPVDRWYEAHLLPVRMRQAATPAQPDFILITLRDLTRLRRVEEMRADFVANASHELRTPLASLAGFIETLQGPARDDPAARERFLAIMKQQAHRMARLIDDLLSLSRIELKAHVRPETPIDLASVLRQVADAMQTLARDREVDIVISTPDEAIIVPGDRDELMRLCENLVENALKYGAAGKRVEITLARTNAQEAPEALLSVTDFGPGIAPEHLPRLTERFYRVDVAQSRAEGGTGLGLALVKHIVNRHRGRLIIESDFGHGATFSVRLPLAQGLAPNGKK